MVLLKDGCMLGQKTQLLLLDDRTLTVLFLLLEVLLGLLSHTLLLVDCELLLPQAFDLALVFQLAHASPLSVHLLQSIVLCELLQEFALEFFFHASLLLSTLLLKSKLVFASGLKLLSNTHALLGLSSLLCLGSLFAFLHVKVVSELLLEHLLGGTNLLFVG